MVIIVPYFTEAKLLAQTFLSKLLAKIFRCNVCDNFRENLKIETYVHTTKNGETKEAKFRKQGIKMRLLSICITCVILSFHLSKVFNFMRKPLMESFELSF